MILFRFCSNFCCLSMGDSYNFRLCYELPTECNSGAKQHCPTHSIVVRWGQNVVDCSYFFNFGGCIIATQIHWKMLLVVNHMPFLSWIYLNVCETVCNRDLAVCLWQFNTHYAPNSIFSGATLRDYICLLVRITNRWYVRNHFISNVLKIQSYSASTQAQ